MSDNKTIRTLFIVLTGLVFFGTISFYFIEGESLWISFYSTMIILLSHFIHGKEDPISVQVLTILLTIGSFFIVAYIIKLTAEYFLGGEYKEKRRKKRMASKIEKMKEHFIVCGFGRVGRQVAEDLAHSEDADFVVIDRDCQEIATALSLGYNAFTSDPTDEDNLKKAGIDKAKALISCLGEDTDNLFVTLTARGLNPEVYIVARVNDEDNKSKFERAGANRVAMPYQIGGYHMATMALRPAVLDFLDVIVDSRHDELEVEEMEVSDNSELVGKKIIEELSREKRGVTVLALNRKDGSSRVNPSGQELIHPGDKVIIMGNRKQLDSLTELVS